MEPGLDVQGPYPSISEKHYKLQAIIFNTSFTIRTDKMDTELSKVIMERRSVRIFTEQNISSEIIDNLIEAAIWAPSSCNRQPWHFVIVKKHSLKEGISHSLASKGSRKLMMSAPAVIVVCVDISKYWGLSGNLAPFLDAGVAIQNILLKAQSLGLGSCTIAGHINEEIVKKELNLSDNHRVMGFIPIGYPKKIPPPPMRQDTSNYYSVDSYKPGNGTERFSDVCVRRSKVTRSGGDVSGNYGTPRENIPIFEFARDVISKEIKGNEDVLFTFSGLGFFLRSTLKNVSCLVFSKDEEWYLKEVIGLENPLILTQSYDDLTHFIEKYDLVISLFDVHFMERREIDKFLKRLEGMLNDSGRIILVTLNKKSFYGLNHKLAGYFNVNLESIRPCGYEHPVIIEEITRSVPDVLRVENIRTGSFLPSPNIGYIMDRSPHIPYKSFKLQRILQNLPFFRKHGNVAFITLKKSH
jgi:nitroreductase